MGSARVCAGPDVIDTAGNAVSVLAAPDGTVTILHAEAGVTELDPRARDELRELLDRAAMPGQPERTAEAHAAQAGDGGG